MTTLEQKINAKRKLIAKHEHELSELYKLCDHEGYVVQKDYYFPGSYYDKAYTESWNECTLCGAKSEKTCTDHSWYG